MDPNPVKELHVVVTVHYLDLDLNATGITNDRFIDTTQNEADFLL